MSEGPVTSFYFGADSAADQIYNYVFKVEGGIYNLLILCNYQALSSIYELLLFLVQKHKNKTVSLTAEYDTPCKPSDRASRIWTPLPRVWDHIAIVRRQLVLEFQYDEIM